MKRLTNTTPYFIAMAVLLIGFAIALGIAYSTDKVHDEAHDKAVKSVSDPLDGPLPVWLRVEDTKANKTGDRK